MRYPTIVSAQLEWESFSQWCWFLGKGQFIHAEGFSTPFSNMYCISRRTYGRIYNQKAVEGLGALHVRFKNSNPFRARIGGVILVYLIGNESEKTKLYLAPLFKGNDHFSLFRKLTERGVKYVLLNFSFGSFSECKFCVLLTPPCGTENLMLESHCHPTHSEYDLRCCIQTKQCNSNCTDKSGQIP